METNATPLSAQIDYNRTGRKNTLNLRLPLALALAAVFATQPVIAQCTRTQFQPPKGPLNFAVVRNSAVSNTHNGFTLTRQIQNGGARIQYICTRPSPQSSVTFTRDKRSVTPNTLVDFNVVAAFVGDHGLLFEVDDSGGDTLNRRIEAVYFDLSAANPTEQRLFTDIDFQLQASQDTVLAGFFVNTAASTDASCLLTLVDKSIVTPAQRSILNIAVFRTDTGASLCSLANQSSSGNTAVTTGAEILDLSLPTGSDTVRIRSQFGTNPEVRRDCPLPVPDLRVSPQPREFGTIANNETLDRAVTFSNPGQEPMEVTGIGPSAHFAPVNVVFPFVLDVGESRNVSIRFTPGGANGFFDETLAVTRCPEFGANQVRCTGSAAPAVTVQRIEIVPSIPESATSPTPAFRVSRTGSTASSLTVNLTTGGSATPGGSESLACGGPDYLQLQPTVTIPSGSDHQDVPLSVFNDAFDEASETVILNIATGPGYIVGSPSAAMVSIIDDDPPPVMKIVGRSFPEGTKSSTHIVADVTLSAQSGRQITVNWSAFTSLHLPTRIDGFFLQSTATGGASCGGASTSDFVITNSQLVFPPCTTNQTISVAICGDFVREPDDTFFIALTTPVNVTLGFIAPNSILLAGNAVCTILNDDLLTGSFELTPADPVAAVHERLNYAFTWTVPEPLNWHDLQFLQLRLRDGDDVILSLLFDEASKTFVLLNEKTGQPERAGIAGKPNRLQTPEATLYLADTTVVGSGPTGPSVTLNLSLSFKPQAARRTFVVEVAASDDLGNHDDFVQAGTLTVTPSK